MIIEKTSKNILNYKRKIYQFNSAREGFSRVINSIGTDKTVFLLPSYIGISPNEGSGIFDPIQENKVEYKFYKMDKKLHIDVSNLLDLFNSVDSNIKMVLLIVHYFGFVDPNIQRIVDEARKRNVFIIEDEAHAMYTDLIDEKCGRYGDISLFSLHKMLPFESGGLVRDNTSTGILDGVSNLEFSYNWMDYDLFAISEKRKENAKVIYEILKDNKDIVCIRGDEYAFYTPQTYPVIVPEGVRNDLYFSLNEQGYGLVSLYHTLIPQINCEQNLFSTSLTVSSSITNLPVHQDVQKDQLRDMVNLLVDLVNKYVNSRK